MVVPIIVGIGITLAALTAKLTISAFRKYAVLTPQMIASLNNIKLTGVQSSDITLNDHLQFLTLKFPNTPFRNPMTEQEALLILGIKEDEILDLSKSLIKKRYRQLIILNHPDKNGSQYLSQKLNQAKEILENSYMINK